MELTEALRALLRGGNAANTTTPPRGALREWFSIRNLADGETEVFLYDVIGDLWFGGVTAADFVRELRAINARKILLRINSPGGSIDDAVTIRNALIEHPATIETHIDGLAASAASWVGLVGEKVIMSPHATMMIHEPIDIAMGDALAMHKMGEVLDHYGDEIAEMLQEKAGGTREGWRARMREETWYSDQEAVNVGLADEISGQPAEPADNRHSPTVVLIMNIFTKTPAALVNRATPLPPPQKPGNAPAANDPEQHEQLVHESLVHQRDESRRRGVLV